MKSLEVTTRLTRDETDCRRSKLITLILAQDDVCGLPKCFHYKASFYSTLLVSRPVQPKVEIQYHLQRSTKSSLLTEATMGSHSSWTAEGLRHATMTTRRPDELPSSNMLLARCPTTQPAFITPSPLECKMVVIGAGGGE